MAELDQEDRDDLRKDQFAYVDSDGGEHLPINDESHVRNALARARPTIVIWMSVWEKSDLVIGGHTIVAETPQWEAEIMSRMDAALARLTAGDARVVLVTEAAPAPNPAQRTETTDRNADDAGYVRGVCFGPNATGERGEDAVERADTERGSRDAQERSTIELVFHQMTSR